MISAEMLGSIKAFSEMTEEQRAAIHKHCELLQFQRGGKLFTEGDKAEHMWNVVTGQVDLRFEMPDRRPTSADMTVSSVEAKEKEPLRFFCVNFSELPVAPARRYSFSRTFLRVTLTVAPIYLCASATLMFL